MEQRGDTPQPVLAWDTGVLHNSHLQSSQTTAAHPLLSGPGLCLKCPAHPSSVNHTISLNPSTLDLDRGYILRDTNPSINRYQLHFIWAIIRRLLCGVLDRIVPHRVEKPQRFSTATRSSSPRTKQEQPRSLPGKQQTHTHTHTHLLNDFCFVNESGAMSLITTAWE